MILSFDAAKVRKLFQHSQRAKKHESLYGKKTGIGLFLVGDQGVYLMSTGLPRPPRKNDQHVVYADQVNPKTLPFDEWWEAKNASFGGDDGVEFLEAGLIETALKRQNRGRKVYFDVSKTKIRV